ncbi:MAG TPA: T9SS type A sorting domain-containing protein [Candidatus Kapabacteria bacterium]|jgi:hypothetical protein|nr:T9SS type A sorting domain-containing protein [Candidatus Kapabacteria bacterium]
MKRTANFILLILSLILPSIADAQTGWAETLPVHFRQFEVQYYATVKTYHQQHSSEDWFSEWRIQEQHYYQQSVVQWLGSKCLISATNAHSDLDTTYFIACIDTVSGIADSVVAWRNLYWSGKAHFEQTKLWLKNVQWTLLNGNFGVEQSALAIDSSFSFYLYESQLHPNPELQYWYRVTTIGISDTSRPEFRISLPKSATLRLKLNPRFRAWNSGNKIEIEGAEGGEIRIFDLLGRLVRAGREEPLGGMQPGVYVVVSRGESVTVLVGP